MKVIPTALPEVLILGPKVFGDDRGFFFESYNRQTFAADTGLDVEFVQDNHSRSAQGVLRGLHYQLVSGRHLDHQCAGRALRRAAVAQAAGRHPEANLRGVALRARPAHAVGRAGGVKG